MPRLSKVGSYLSSNLVPRVASLSRLLLNGIEQVFNSLVILLLCLLCFAFGVYSELEHRSPPETMMQFCQQALDPEIKASKRALYFRNLFDGEKK